jgi:hypothetical protein
LKSCINNDELLRAKEKQGGMHTMALPFTLKNILRQKKNYGNTIFHHAKI